MGAYSGLLASVEEDWAPRSMREGWRGAPGVLAGWLRLAVELPGGRNRLAKSQSLHCSCCVVRLNLLEVWTSFQSLNKRPHGLTSGRSWVCLPSWFLALFSCNRGCQVQGKCQRVAGAIHAFSIVWRLPKACALLQRGKLARFGTSCVYRRICLWNSQGISTLCSGNSLAAAKDPRDTIHLFLALKGASQPTTPAIPW